MEKFLPQRIRLVKSLPKRTYIFLYLCLFLMERTNAAAVPSYVWPLAFIYNNTVPVTPPMMVHGGVSEGAQQSLVFDGVSGWIDAGDFTGQCIVNPSVCKDGLSVGLRVKFDNDQSSRRAYVFDSGGHIGNGVSIYILDRKLFVEVGSANLIWQLNVPLETERWHFLLLTWSSRAGLLLFLDGPIIASTSQTQPVNAVQRDENHITLGKANYDHDVTYGRFSMEMVAIFNKFVPKGRVLLSYSFSPPNQPKGNVRYVNVRFVNKGQQPIKIYPDRGARKDSGYAIGKKVSTLLEFVLREGPIPYGMDFLIRREDTQAVLLFNGKNWIHVEASDDSQVVTEVNISDDGVTSLIYSTRGVTPNFEMKNTTSLSITKKLLSNAPLVHTGGATSSFNAENTGAVETAEKLPVFNTHLSDSLLKASHALEHRKNKTAAVQPFHSISNHTNFNDATLETYASPSEAQAPVPVAQQQVDMATTTTATPPVVVTTKIPGPDASTIDSAFREASQQNIENTRISAVNMPLNSLSVNKNRDLFNNSFNSTEMATTTVSPSVDNTTDSITTTPVPEDTTTTPITTLEATVVENSTTTTETTIVYTTPSTTTSLETTLSTTNETTTTESTTVTTTESTTIATTESTTEATTTTESTVVLPTTPISSLSIESPSQNYSMNVTGNATDYFVSIDQTTKSLDALPRPVTVNQNTAGNVSNANETHQLGDTRQPPEETGEDCKTCKPGQVTMSSEQSTNLTKIVDGLNVLSAIKGSLNTSHDNVTDLSGGGTDHFKCEFITDPVELEKCKMSANFPTLPPYTTVAGENETTTVYTTPPTISSAILEPSVLTTTTAPLVETTTTTTTVAPTTTEQTTTTITPVVDKTIQTTTTHWTTVESTSTTPAPPESTTTTTAVPYITPPTTTTAITQSPWRTFTLNLNTPAPETPPPPPPPPRVPFEGAHWSFKMVDTPVPPLKPGCFQYGGLQICSTVKPPVTTTTTTTTTLLPTTERPTTPVKTTTQARRTTKSLPTEIPTRPAPVFTQYITRTPSHTTLKTSTTTTTTKKPTKSAVKYPSPKCVCKPVTAYILPCCTGQSSRIGVFPVPPNAITRPVPQPPQNPSCVFPYCPSNKQQGQQQNQQQQGQQQQNQQKPQQNQQQQQQQQSSSSPCVYPNCLPQQSTAQQQSVAGNMGTIMLTPNQNGVYNVLQSPVVQFNNANQLKQAALVNSKQQQGMLAAIKQKQKNEALAYKIKQAKQKQQLLQQDKIVAGQLRQQEIQRQRLEAAIKLKEQQKQQKLASLQQQKQSYQNNNAMFKPNTNNNNNNNEAYNNNNNINNDAAYNSNPSPGMSQQNSFPQNIAAALQNNMQAFNSFAQQKPQQSTTSFNQLPNTQGFVYNQATVFNPKAFSTFNNGAGQRLPTYNNNNNMLSGKTLNMYNYPGNNGNFGNLGSPQVFNWRSPFSRVRSKEEFERPAMTPKFQEEENIYADAQNMSPNKLWRNSMVITIDRPLATSANLNKDNNNYQHESQLPFTGSSETLSGHVGSTLLLTELENNVIPGVPEITVAGNVRKWQGGLKLDGKTAWLNATKINAGFLTLPSLATEEGFAIGFRLMLDNNMKQYKQPKYIIDAGGVEGRGTSLFIENGVLFCVVTMANNMWQASSNLTVDEWIYLAVAWRPAVGLSIYANGIRMAESKSAFPSNPAAQPINNDVIIGANRALDVDSFLLMYISSIDIMRIYPDPMQLVQYGPPVVKPNFVLTFSSLLKGSVRNHPQLKAHEVKENRGVLLFDGVQSYLQDGGEFTDTFVMMPSLSRAGLTFSVKFKYDRLSLKSSKERFILDTGGWLGHGVSLFVDERQLYAVVGSKGSVWVARTSEEIFTSWCLVVVTWRPDMGIYVYINGALIAKEKPSRYQINGYPLFEGMTFGCNVLKGASSFGRFQLAMTSFFPSYTAVDELMKISPPLVLRPTFDWFLLLVQNNRTLTSPSLRVNGGVTSTEEGLLFDGSTGWIETDPLDNLSEENSQIVCEHFQKELTCPSAQTIRVAYANYGRTSDMPCQGARKYITTNCKSSTTLPKAKLLCDGKQTCTVKSLNSIWGNTCPGVVKYLDIRYQCVGYIHNNESQLFNGAHFLTNPQLTNRGLTVALKIKLSRDTEYYSTPHFIVDSGGYHSNGVSLYTMERKLFGVVAMGKLSWKVSCAVDSEDWLYILMTWRKDQGLVLYVNGALKGVTTQGSQQQLATIMVADKLVLGRSVFNSTYTQTAFHVTTFTVLKTFVSRSESFRMFSYYIGRAIPNTFEAASLTQDTVIICEYQSRTIACPADQVIEIVFANYGRTSQRPCAWGTHHETNCTQPSAMERARDVCNGRNTCELVAKNSMWKGNPCPGIIKYVEVKYVCDGATPRDATSAKYIGNEDPNSLVIP